MSLMEFTKEMPSEFAVMEKFAITQVQARILLRLWQSGDDGTDDLYHYRSVRQHIYNMRKRLKPFGITILNLADRRYGMPLNSRTIMARLFNWTS